MIGGNVTAEFQIKSDAAVNEIGERVSGWVPVQSLVGFLDFSGGDSKRMTYDAKIQESSHVFICDWVALDESIKESNSRIVISSKQYDVLLIDNPMELNEHLEIFLKYVGE